MKLTLSTAGVVSVIAVVALTGTACSNDSSTTETSASSPEAATSSAEPTSASAAPIDYTTVLIKAEDIVIPGETFTAGEPQLNPGGVEGVAAAYSNAEETRTIGDSLVVLPDAAAAKTALDGGVAALGQSILDPAPKPVPVGTEGVFAAGESPDGTKSVTVVTFTQGAGYVVMQFDSVAGDPVPEDFAIALAQKQAELLQDSLG